MTVYLDELFLLNAALNYLLLLGSARLGGGVIRHGRLALAAALGGVYAAAALWPPLAFFRALGMKAVTLALMLLTAFGLARRTMRLGALFLALAFCRSCACSCLERACCCFPPARIIRSAWRDS